MPLKAILESLDDVPEALHEMYRQDGDLYVLDVEGVDSHPGVKNLKSAFEREKQDRKTAREKLKEYEAKLAEIEDLDPAEARKALAKLSEIETKKLMDEGEFDKALEKRVANMKKDYENQIKALTGNIDALSSERDTFQKQLHEHVIESGLRDAAMKKGVRPEAVPDVLYRLRSTWQLRDGKPVPLDGEDILYGKDGKGPLTMEESVEGLMGSAPHLFMASSGGGLSGGRGGGPGRASIRNDHAAISSNLEAVASGKVVVTDD